MLWHGNNELDHILTLFTHSFILVACSLYTRLQFCSCTTTTSGPSSFVFYAEMHDDLIELECISLPRSHTTNPTRHKRDVTQGHIYVCVGSGANTFGNLVYICTEPNVH